MTYNYKVHRVPGNSWNFFVPFFRAEKFLERRGQRRGTKKRYCGSEVLFG